MNKKVIIIGGEGNGGVIAACIEDNRRRFGDPEWEVAGFVNDYETQVCGYPVLGGTDDVGKLLENPEYHFMWGIHMIGRNILTEKTFRRVNIPRERFATIVHKPLSWPTAPYSSRAHSSCRTVTSAHRPGSDNAR